MILILSQSHYETATNDVIEWLRFYKAKYIRINGKNLIEGEGVTISINPTKDEIEIFKAGNDNKLFNKVNVVWFRRWIALQEYPNNKYFRKNELLNISISKYLKKEFDNLSKAFLLKFSDAYWLNTPNFLKSENSKFKQLFLAKKTGIDIPLTLITGDKKELINFYNKANKEVITKSISEVGVFPYKKSSFGTFTNIIDEKTIKDLPSFFYPSLFQQKINKEFEIRIFFIENTFFPMAIFSSLDEQTKLDFRKYNLNKPNRYVPFRLPKSIMQKLRKLMKSLELNSGSIDMIFSDTGKYYFLEVNPVGQFGMVSYPCNYNIEQFIAKHLIEKSKNGKKIQSN